MVPVKITSGYIKMRHPKPEIFLRLSLIMAAANGAMSLFFRLVHDKDASLIFLVGTILWLIAVFVWIRNVENGW